MKVFGAAIYYETKIGYRGHGRRGEHTEMNEETAQRLSSNENQPFGNRYIIQNTPTWLEDPY